MPDDGNLSRAQSKHHPDLIMCRKMPGISIGRLCEKCAWRANANANVNANANAALGRQRETDGSGETDLVFFRLKS